MRELLEGITSKHCPNDEQSNHGGYHPINHNFCVECGSKLIPVKTYTLRCDKCLTPASILMNFCPNCGEKLNRYEETFTYRSAHYGSKVVEK